MTMNIKNQLNQFEHELEYLDYLLTVAHKPHSKGVLKNIKRRIKALNAFIKSETKNPSDAKLIERALLILNEFNSLKERYHLIYPKQ